MKKDTPNVMKKGREVEGRPERERREGEATTKVRHARPQVREGASDSTVCNYVTDFMREGVLDV